MPLSHQQCLEKTNSTLYRAGYSHIQSYSPIYREILIPLFCLCPAIHSTLPIPYIHPYTLLYPYIGYSLLYPYISLYLYLYTLLFAATFIFSYIFLYLYTLICRDIFCLFLYIPYTVYILIALYIPYILLYILFLYIPFYLPPLFQLSLYTPIPIYSLISLYPYICLFPLFSRDLCFVLLFFLELAISVSRETKNRGNKKMEYMVILI